ncbi:hypothetical protein GCM10009733_097850 [Nonomuraea maheshkhaliensis]|uniref:Uncharacterized protein n=1 Tax=Nonomuraea maheshkhaliensis TaxID=419590 RepID=A0ABP4TC59_9ACTN
MKLRADLAKATLKELNELAAASSPQMVITANTSKPAFRS